jgi:predicted nucleic acid-binding protein
VKFVDTSYWVALRLRRDDNHERAMALWEPGRPLLTTNHVVGETWTFLRRRDSHQSAVEFIEAVEAAEWLTVVHVEEKTERDAWSWLRRHDERTYSFVDATSFATMRRERISQALAFDGDFTAAGFVEVRPASP